MISTRGYHTKTSCPETSLHTESIDRDPFQPCSQEKQFSECARSLVGTFRTSFVRMSLHVITQSQRPILKLYVPELNMVYSRKDVRGTVCPAAFKLKQTALLLLVQSYGTIGTLHPVNLRSRGTLLVPTGSLAGSKLKLLPMCASQFVKGQRDLPWPRKKAKVMARPLKA